MIANVNVMYQRIDFRLTFGKLRDALIHLILVQFGAKNNFDDNSSVLNSNTKLP